LWHWKNIDHEFHCKELGVVTCSILSPPLDFLFAVMVGHPDDKPKTVGSFLGAKQTESGVEATTPLMILANTPWHLK